MTKNTKRLFFYVAVAVFLILSCIVILYAQGYKYSFSGGRFQRTGAISMKVNVGAKIFLNDEVQGDTSFFGSSYSIDRLLPGNYKLTVKKDGYSSWQKKVTVEGGFVTDFPEIMILPEDGEEEQKLFEEVDTLFKELKQFPTLEPSPMTVRGSIKTSPTPVLHEEPFLLDNKTGLPVQAGKLYRADSQQLEEIADNVKGFRLS